MLGKSSSSERFVDFFERENRRIILKKEIASFFGRVYWFAPFGALASYGMSPDDLHLGRSETRFSPVQGGRCFGTGLFDK